jgi:eukaryotic-like serine/threonine-protein kinase
MEDEPRADELFARALALEDDERERFLAGMAEAEPGLVAEVRSLLEHHDSAGDFLSMPAVLDLDPELGLPERIGSYRILGRLGGGGMGIVYLARQEHPRRTVALKVIRPLFVTGRLLKRFALEAEVLGRLHHPGIAQIYEAGTADAGYGPQPYFAMELVSGLTLDRYVEQRGLGLRERLALVADLCDAIEHAHRQGVIHRDLKPGNVLVDESAAQPRVKVLDFGVARATDADLQTITQVTDPGQLVGTLAYMSPEQAAGGSAPIDARADVYSLGVLAYELCSGRLPHELAGRPMHEAARILREEDPTPLSSVQTVLRGDVETIVAKALEKEPARRYPSAAALAADIRRWLAHEPIVARPPSRGYQLWKLARRHRALVGGVAAVILALAAGLVATTRQTVLLAAERDRVVEQTGRALRVADWFESLLAQSVPAVPGAAGRDVRLVDVLKHADRLGDELTADPEIEQRIRSALGRTYIHLGEPERAEQQLRIAHTRALEAFGPDDPTSYDVLATLGHALLSLDRLDEAEGALREALAGLERLVGEGDARTQYAAETLGTVLYRQRRLVEAEDLMRRTLDGCRALGPEHAGLALEAQDTLALILGELGRWSEAEALQRDALERGRELDGPEHPDTLAKINNLALTLAMEGRVAEAAELRRGLFDTARRVLGERHPDTLSCMNNLGMTLADMGELEEGLDLLRSAYELRRETLGPDHASTLTSLNNLAEILSRAGRNEEAEPLLVDAVAVLERRFGATDTRTLLSKRNLARIWIELGRSAEALPVLREIVAAESATEPPVVWRLSTMRLTLGACLLTLRRYDEAEPELLAAHEGLERTLGEANPRTRSAVEHLVALYDAWGRPDDARCWRDVPGAAAATAPDAGR